MAVSRQNSLSLTPLCFATLFAFFAYFDDVNFEAKMVPTLHLNLPKNGFEVFQSSLRSEQESNFQARNRICEEALDEIKVFGAQRHRFGALNGSKIDSK